MFKGYLEFNIKQKIGIVTDDHVAKHQELYDRLYEETSNYAERLMDVFSNTDSIEDAEIVEKLRQVTKGDDLDGAIFDYKFITDT